MPRFENISQPKVHPQGEFFGHIVSVSVERSSSSGARYLLIKIKTKAGTVSTSLHPESDNYTARSIAQSTCKTIMQSYIDEPIGTFDFFTEMPAMMQDLPVLIYVKHKGPNDLGYMDYRVYFRPVHPRDRVVRRDGKVIERVRFNISSTSA
jgi:hypothetical protein